MVQVVEYYIQYRAHQEHNLVFVRNKGLEYTNVGSLWARSSLVFGILNVIQTMVQETTDLVPKLKL